MGRVIMSGIVPTLKAPVTGIAASTLAVGSTVKLMESGAAVEYLVVNQGKPSGSSLYDDSCDGTWLWRKTPLTDRMQFNSTAVNGYGTSSINTYLNGTFFNTFGTAEQAVIKETKIPYRYGNTTNATPVYSGVNGLSVKAFLLSCYEVGILTDTTSSAVPIPAEGGKCSYFEEGQGTSANAIRAYGSAPQWTRTPYCSANYGAYGNAQIAYNGGLGVQNVTNTWQVRPAVILDSAALFDPDTMLLKGVA